MIAQSLHAATEYGFNYPEKHAQWNDESKYVVCLEAQDETHLEKLKLKLSMRGIDYASFVEPDLNSELTAISFIAPHSEAKRIISSLPLALKQENKDG